MPEDRPPLSAHKPVTTKMIEPFRRFSTADWIVAGTALFIICNGVSVCAGWWLRIPILVQLPPDAPTHFNTALIFVLLGVGELGLVLRRRGVVNAMAVVVTCVASAELAEYALGRNLGIDTLLAAPFVGFDARYPGRMSGNTVACFFLVCGAQVLMSTPDRGTGATTTAAVVLKSLAGGTAFVALLGYLVGLRSAYGWTVSVGMSIRSCAGFLLIDIATIAALWQRDIVNRPNLPDWFLPFLTISVASISIGLWWIFSSSLARPFMLDPVYAGVAHRRSIAILSSVGMLVVLGTISVLVARHKAIIARASEKKLASVLEHMSEGVMLIDAKGDAFYQNPASLRIHGFKPKGSDSITDQERPVSWNAWDETGRALNLDEWPFFRVSRGERVQNQVLRARRCETGHEFFASYNGSPIYDDHGELALSFITIQDITGRRQAESEVRESEARFRSLANAIPQLAWMARADGFFFWCNQRWHDYTGTTPEQMEGRGWQSLHDPAVLPTVVARWRDAIALAQPFEMEFPLRGADGTFRNFLTRGQPMKDAEGRLVQWFGTCTDVDQLKRTEQSLRENNRRLERSNRDLEDFARIASHDLKTPLNGIKSAALWLEEDLHDLPEESQKLLGLMRSRINRMETLLDDLLTFSRVGRTDTAAGETSLADIFASILEVLNPPAHIRVRTEGELPNTVTASAQLEQVLRNLINNAVKHHDKPSGEVVLSAKRVGDFVEFAVRDDGPGILPRFHEKIFELFQTLKRRDEAESTGMGLAIVKKLIERQNCRITVHSEGNGTGTEFRFRWPASSAAMDVEDPASA